MAGAAAGRGVRDSWARAVRAVRAARGGVALAAVGAALALAPAAARAAVSEPDATSRSGFYLGLGASYAVENFSLTSDDLGMTAILGPGVDPNYDDSQGVDVQIGWRARPWLAVEFLYGFLEGFDSTAGVPSTEIDSHLVTLNAKLFPCGGRIQPYGLFGIGTHIINSEVLDPAVRKPFETDAGFVTRVGGGIDYYATDHFVVELEGAYMQGSGGIVKDAEFGAFGLHFLYRF